jgi:transposase
VILKKEYHKGGDKFYVSFTVYIPRKRKVIINQYKWISLDPNHKNFAVDVDYKGDSYEFSVLKCVKTLDKEIDKLQSMVDVCKKEKVKKLYDSNGNYVSTSITKGSKRYYRRVQALKRLSDKKREQIKQILYTISHQLCKNYDYIAIGNYVPSVQTNSITCIEVC